MLRLCDGQAQPWRWRVGEKTLNMLPLSLATFAMAEDNGCGLDELLGGTGEEQITAWIQFYALLSDQHPDTAAEDMMHTEVFNAFVARVESSFESDKTRAESPEPVKYNHRRAKDPRELISAGDGRTMKQPEEASDEAGESNTPKRPGTDYSVLFDLARFTKVPLSDIYRMTFRGMSQLSKYAKDNPPVPVPSLLGGMGEML